MNHFEEKLESKTLYEGRVLTLTYDTVRLEDGRQGTREVVHHNGGAAVIPLYDNGDVALVRQFRYAAGKELLEIPAGKLEKGEDPFAAAKRELGEEVGLTAATYLPLGHIIPTCGYCTERIYLYAAKDFTQVPRHLDEDEFVTVERMPLEQAVALVMSGDIEDSKTAVALLKVQALRAAGTF